MKINIKNKKTKKQLSKERKSQKLKEQEIRNEQIGNEKKKLLHPMVGALLAGQLSKNPNNDFIKNSFDVVMNNPHFLSDKWINSLNKWAINLMERMSLDEPDVEIGEVLETCITMEKRKDTDYGNWRYTGIDNNGWRFNFGSGNNYVIGSSYSIKGKVKKHYEGMTILSRVTAKINLPQIKKEEE